MRRWKVVVYDMTTGEHSLPDRYFRHSAAVIAMDRFNALHAYTDPDYRAFIIDERWERRCLRQRRLSNCR